MDYITYMDRRERLQNIIITWDKKVMDKRKMLLSIERENVMTILSALRAVPKKPDENKKDSPMASFLNRKRAGDNA